MKLTSKTLCRILCGCIACLLLVGFLPVGASAATSYESYTYNSRELAVPTAAPYTVSQILKGEDFVDANGNSYKLSTPGDIYVTENNWLYIADQGNARVIVLDESLEMVDVIDISGLMLSNITGVFVYTEKDVTAQPAPDYTEGACADGHTYENGVCTRCAETQINNRIVVCGESYGTYSVSVLAGVDTVYNGMTVAKGELLYSVDKPEAAVIDEKFIYEPIKAEVDSGGIMYVLNQNSSEGALQFSKGGDPVKSGEFMGFYGTEEVDLTFEVLLRHFWKSVLSEEAAEKMARTVSVQFDSFCIDQKDFVFTIRSGAETVTGQVRKLNAKGANVMDETRRFGDHIEAIMLADIAVDDDGFITVIDRSNGHIMQYDPDGEMLYAFGGIGTQEGTFTEPIAVETMGDKLFVLDKQAGLITVFEPTDFAANVRKATLLYRDGKYEEAIDYWTEVLALDNNYELANNGMGKIHEGLGDMQMTANNVDAGMTEYQTAMEYYKRGNSKKFYSDAFEDYRGAILREYFGLFMVLIAAVFLVPLVLMSRKPKAKEVYAGGRPKSKYPFYCMFHPMNGYDDLKAENSGSFWRANCILAALFVVSVLAHQLTGFAYNMNRVEQLNIWVTLCSTIGVFLAFVVCNWAVTTIMDGKGKLKEIWIFMAYAMLPYVLFSAAMIVCSNVLTIDESAFYTAIQWVGYLWTALCIVIGLREVHMYSLKKTFGTIIITILGLVIVVVLVAIVYSVFSQLIGFITTVWSEISMRA